MLDKAKDFLRRHERHLSSAGLIGGFIFDYFTLWRIDLIQEELIFVFYIFAAGFVIWRLSRDGKDKYYNYLLFALQFCFGGLLGRFFIFYSMSGSFSVSWPFLLIIASLFVINERLRNRYELFTFRMIIYFVVVFSFFIFFLPILLTSISPLVFLLSGIVSLFVVNFFAHFVYHRFPSLAGEKTRVTYGIVAVFILINGFYVLNIIPPIPLSLKDVELAHSVHKVSTGYEITFEQQPWYKFLLTDVYHKRPGEPVYIFTSVFAPTGFDLEVVYLWQHEVDGQWQDAGRIPFPISGGTDQGYRGYTYNENATPGLWRVLIETARGQVIGQVKFKVEEVSTAPATKTELR